jgi:hypothetical protein
MKDKKHRSPVRSLVTVLLVLILLGGTAAGGWHWYDNNVDRSGWVQLDNGTGYKDFHGKLVTGWQEIEGSRRYFRSDNTLAVGELEIDGSRYWFAQDGQPLTGWQTRGEDTFFYSSDGILRTGWQDYDSGKRYFLPEGPMVTGWQELEGNRYLFSEDGLMTTGWHKEGEYHYYFQEDGRAAVGPTMIDGQMRYFSPKGIHVILVNALNPVPDWFQLDPVNVVDYHDVDRLCYDALMQMLADLTGAGIDYTFNSAYRTIVEQTTILEYRTREHMAHYGLDFYAARNKAYETVAIPGTSEHHLGLAVDLLGEEAVAWLTKHCWDYGFIVRYTEAKEHITGIVDEPWHFRYVGREVSLDMKDSGLCLEEYLGAEAVTFSKAQALYGDELYQETVWEPPATAQTAPAAEPAPTEKAA